MSITDDDLDFGGRVFIIDGFSAVAARIGQSFTSLRSTFARGIGALDASTRGLQAAFRRGAADLRTFAGVLGGGLATGLRAAQSAAGGFASGLNRADHFAAGFERTVRRTTAPLRRFGAELSAALGGIGRYLSLGGLLHGVMGLGTAAAQSASRMENLRIAFGRMLGSSQAAEQHLRELQAFAARTPFDFTGLVEQSQRLKAYGFQVGEIIPLLQDFGDAAFASGRGAAALNTYTRVFGAIRGAGRMTFGQITQLNNQGIPALEILREQLHLTGEQVAKIARSGIPAERIINALRTGMRQRFGGGMAQALQTITARVSNLGDIWEQFLVRVGDHFKPAVLSLLEAFARAVDAVNMDRLAARLSGVLSVTTLVGKGVVAVLSILGGAVSDTAERWNGATGGMARSSTEAFGRVSVVLDGVVALLSTSNSRGVARIRRDLHENLVRQGLWPITLKVAQWGDRLRQVVGGFIDGFARDLRRTGEQLRGYAQALGLVPSGMVMNRESARQLGEQLARLIRHYAELRVAMLGLSAATTVVNGAITFGKGLAAVGRGVGWALGLMARFVRWLPVAAAWVGRFGSFLRALGTVASRLGLGAVGTGLAVVAAQVTGVVLVWRHWQALQRNTAPMLALRAAASAVLGPWYALVHLVRSVPAELTAVRGALGRVGQWFSATFRRVGPMVGGALAGSASWVGRGLAAWFAPVGRFLRVFGAFVSVGMYLPVAMFWAKAGPPLTRFVRAAGALLSRTGHAIGGFFVGVGHGIASLAGRFGSWVSGLAASAAHAAGQFALGVARRVVDLTLSVRGVFGRLRASVAGFFSGLGARAVVFFGPLLARAAGFASALQAMLGRAFHWIADTARSAFSGLADTILSPLRALARQLVALFRSLPASLQPAGMAAMVSTLEQFGGGAGGPAGGAAPTAAQSPPSPALVPSPTEPGASPAPAAPPVPVSVQRQAAAQAQGAARGAAAPAVTVHVPQPVVQTVNLVVSDRVIASSVNNRNETERLREGR